MSDVLAPENEPFTKTKFAIRIDILESEIKQLRKIDINRQKQIKQMSELHRKLNIQFTKVAQVTDLEVESFRKYFLMFLVLPEDEKKQTENLLSSPQGKAALKQALRVYGTKLVEDKGDIKPEQKGSDS